MVHESERVLARTYDPFYKALRDPSGDVAFYVDQARDAGGAVLELGCGTGRVLIPTAQLGLNCVGLDASAEMLTTLREKNPPRSVELIHSQMETFDLGTRQFRLITAPFRGMQHLLDVEAQLRTLENVRKHLAFGGAFVFDVFDPKLDRMAILEEPETEAIPFVHNGHEMLRWDSIRRDLNSQVMTVTSRIEGGPEALQGTTEIKMRWYYRYELEHLLKRVGFANLTFYGGFGKRPWQAGEDLTVVARVL